MVIVLALLTITPALLHEILLFLIMLSPLLFTLIPPHIPSIILFSTKLVLPPPNDIV